MKSIIQLVGASALALILVGCATSDRHARYDSHRHYVIEDYPVGREVIVDRDGHRTYVREYEVRRERYLPPSRPGKHADSLGWNTERCYLERGY